MKLLKEEVDIYHLPKSEKNYLINPLVQITVGDLHGNAIKLIYILIKYTLFKNIHSEDYHHLVDIYKKKLSKLTNKDLDLLREIINKMECDQKIGLIKFLGDILADRGSNDYFTLKVIEKMVIECGVKIEIHLSNHDFEFIRVLEAINDSKKQIFIPSLLADHFVRSLLGLEVLILKKMVPLKEVVNIYHVAYRPNLKLISCTLSAHNELTIYSHAPIGLKNIKELANELDVPYKSKSQIELRDTIEHIDAKFQEAIQGNKITDLVLPDVIADFYANPFLNEPLASILLNRNYVGLERPIQQAGYKLYFVHGHDSSEVSRDNIFNLDGSLGKADSLNKGTLLVLYEKKESLLLEDLPGPNSQNQLSINPSFTQVTVSPLSFKQSRSAFSCVFQSKPTLDTTDSNLPALLNVCSALDVSLLFFGLFGLKKTHGKFLPFTDEVCSLPNRKFSPEKIIAMTQEDSLDKIVSDIVQSSPKP